MLVLANIIFFVTAHLASMISTIYRRDVIHKTLLERLTSILVISSE